MARNKEINLYGGSEELTSQQKLENKKKKKKRKVVRIVVFSIVGTLLLLIGGCIFAASRAMKKLQSSTVSLAHPETGDIVSEINVNGTIESEKTIHYVSPASMTVKSVKPMGSYVKKGDVIIEFEEDSYNKAMRQLEINTRVSENTYNSQDANGADVRKKIAKAQSEMAQYRADMDADQKKADEYKAIVDNYEKDNKLNNFSAAVQTQIALEQANIAKCQAIQEQMLEAFKESPEYVALDNEAKAEALANFMKTGEYKTLSDSIAQSQTVINNVSKQSTNQSSDYQKALTEYEKYKAKVDADKAKVEASQTEIETYQKTLGNSYDRDSSNLQRELASMQAEDSMDELLKYEHGLIAPFDGVVTMVGFTEGDTAIQGSPIITFSSLEDVHVTLGVGKSDLEKLSIGQKADITILKNKYTGKVATINRSAVSAGNAGTQIMVTVSIDNPDENVYIGLDAKCNILTASVEGVMTVPVEAVNVDDKGEFVFTYNPSTMLVGKKYVTTGVSSEMDIEIVDGLDEKDVIVTSYTGVIEEGKMSSPSPESASFVTEAMGSKK